MYSICRSVKSPELANAVTHPAAQGRGAAPAVSHSDDLQQSQSPLLSTWAEVFLLLSGCKGAWIGKILENLDALWN